MNNKLTNQPPKWANRFLEWYCRHDLLEDLQGDLYEHFDRNLSNKSLRSAKITYWLDVIKFCRPYTIRKFKIVNNINSIVMFKNYFKISFRSIARNKLFSAINIFGLAVGMSVCLLMITLFMEVRSYDRFHDDADRIFRINNIYQSLDEDPSHFASTSIIAGKRLQEEVPGIDGSVIMRRNFGGDAKVGDKVIPVSGVYASEGFFEVFSFKILRGNGATALVEPYSIVLTDETASKIFDEGVDPINQIIKVNDKDFKVTAIVEKPPFNSHLNFQSLASFATHESQEKESDNNIMGWTNMWMNYCYMKLAEGTTAQQVNERLASISAEENEKFDRISIQLTLQSILNIMTGPDLNNQIGASIGGKGLWVFGLLVFVVILSAGFNYTNLSIARSLRRAKEVGVRKVVGATKGQILSQFIIEACVISIISVVLSYGLFLILKPYFLNLAPEIQQTLHLDTPPKLFVYFFLFALLVGTLAGLFPAILLSKLKAVQVMKGVGNMKLFSKINLRKVLIVIQFTLSLVFIISASIAFKQYKYALAFDLGYKTENVLNIELQGNAADQVKSLYEAIPEISEIAVSSHLLSVGSRWGADLKYEDPMDSTTLWHASIDGNYIPMMRHRLLAGTNFDQRPLQEEETEIIVNETTIKRFNVGTPEEAIGKYLKVDDKKLRIIGVIEDFQYAKINEGIDCFGFRYQPEEVYTINLKLASPDLIGTMKKIESAWIDFDPVHEFQATFYDKELQKAYSEYSVMFTLVGFLAFLTMTIASLGLLGMAVYTAETRIKEISIRKVLGATEGSLIALLAKGFMWLLVISAAIAVPLAYFFFDNVILQGAVNRANIGAIELLGGVLIIFAIGFVTIGSQTWKAAKSNPAQTLRNE
jgi:putative ABC transport system permease protein